jgi:hypothetical protein
MSDVTGLIERLERATEGSQELDARIWYALHRDEMPHEGDYHFAPTVEDWLQHVATGAFLVPRYTESLDSALPDENIVQVKRLTHGHPNGDQWQAVNFDPTNHRSEGGMGSTEALARRAAALRARGEP